MSTELLYLTFVTVFTAVLWIPYVLNRFVVRGISDTVGYPSNPKAQSAWATRLINAHANAVDNLVVFATLVLVANAAGISTTLTAMASIVYFWARVAHAVAYALALPWLRTLAFVVGFIAQLTIAWQLLAAA